MNKKHILLSAVCIMTMLPVLALGILTSAQTPDLYYSFESGFENGKDTGTPLISYGNLAFVDTAAKGRGLNLHDGYLNIDNSESFHLTDSFTFSCWFKFNALNAGKPMLLSRTASSGDPYSGPFSIYFSESFEYLRTDLTFKLQDGGYASYSFASGIVFEPQRLMHGWHHVAVVFNKDYLSYYIDGQLSSTEKLPEALRNYKGLANTNQLFSIGRGIGTNMNAAVDEIYFFNSALEYEQVIALYADAKPQLGKEIVLTADSDAVLVNGQRFTAPANAIYDQASGEVLIPAKAVLQHMGGIISWDSEDGFGRADITAGNNSVSVWVYDSHAIVNGSYYKLKAYPVTENGVLLIPASLLSDAFGADTQWKEELQKLTITY